VLCYHSIHPRLPFASATPERFAEQLDWLRTECDVVALGTIASAAGEADGARPRVALTFDDGYADNHRYALPLLVERRLPATLFLTVGLLEGDPASLARLRELRGVAADDLQPLTWEQVLELRNAGLQIGAHTWTHPNLAHLGVEEARGELRRPKQVLEQHLCEPVTAFAYPFGKPGRHFTASTADLVAEAGYEVAVTVLFRAVRPADIPFAIPRFFVTRDDVETLRTKITGAWDWVGVCQERMPPTVARLVSPADFRV
jgi:peptidoglycan/xylan/chitin deacetylase (PgdA/CDA1 family)